MLCLSENASYRETSREVKKFWSENYPYFCKILSVNGLNFRLPFFKCDKIAHEVTKLE